MAIGRGSSNSAVGSTPHLARSAHTSCYGTRLMHSAQVQIHTELEEAAVTAGVPYLRTFLSINLRLLLPAFFNGWLWVLTHTARDFTTPLMVASASSLLASNLIFGRYADGKFPESAAMMVALVVFNVSAVVAGRKTIVPPTRPTYNSPDRHFLSPKRRT